MHGNNVEKDDENGQIDCRIYSSSVAGVDPTFAKKGELPQESYISHMRVDYFSHFFQHCFHSYIFLLNNSISLVDTQTYCKNLRVKLYY